MIYTVFYKTSSFAGYCFLDKNSIYPKRHDVFSFTPFKTTLVKIQICSFIDPNTDMLINIVPEAFFMDTALRIAIVFAIFVTIFFGACLFLWLKGRKAAEKGGN